MKEKIAENIALLLALSSLASASLGFYLEDIFYVLLSFGFILGLIIGFSLARDIEK